MNKKTVFDKHLYKESMRMLLPIGAILLGLLTVFTLLIAAGTLSDGNSYFTGIGQFNEVLTVFYTILYFVIIVLVVPILSLKSFHFLTTRNGSDFYHSIPHKKQCIYITFALSAFTWSSICALVPASILTIVYAIAGTTGYTFGEFILVMLHILVAGLLVMSAISIACAITGTLITNIITTGLILFFPRVFLYACRLILAVITQHFVLENGFLLGTRCNLVVHSIIGYTNNMYYLLSVKPLIYTFVLCIIYILLAIFLFERRHSELAMKATLSRKFQAFLCILLGTAFSIIPIAIICAVSQGPRENFCNYTFTLVTLYVLIIIAMGIYELLATKKARNLVRIIPRTGILAVINLVLIGSLFCCKKVILSDVPSESAIKSVSFGFTNPDVSDMFSSLNNYTRPFDLQIWNDYMSYYTDDYFANKSNTYVTKDETIRKIIAKGLDNASKYKYADSPHSLLVTVNTGTRSMTRTANLSTEDLSIVKNVLIRDDAFLDIFRILPKTDKISLSSWCGGSQLTRAQTLELYKSASEEISSLSMEEWKMLLGRADNTSVDYLDFTTTVNSIRVSSMIPITPVLSKTYDKYFSYVNAQNVDMIKNGKNKIERKDDKQDYNELDYTFVSSDPATMELMTRSIDSESIKDKAFSDFLDALVQIENNPIEPNKKDCTILRISLNRYNSQKDQNGLSVKYIQMDNSTLKSYCEAIDKYVQKQETSSAY